MGDLKCEPLKLENSKEQLLVILALTLFHSSADSSRTDWFKLLMKWTAKVMVLLRRI